MKDADFAEVWRSIEQRLERDKFVVFPVAVDMAGVEWPDDDWSAFLDVALAVGSRLLYVDHDEVTAEDLDTLDEETLADEELQTALKAARANFGGPCRIELAFSYGGVIHRWMSETSWLAVLDEHAVPSRLRTDGGDSAEGFTGNDYLLQREAFSAAREAETERLVPQIAAWVGEIAEHPDYLVAPSQEVRRTVARDLVPELDAWTSAQHGETGEASARSRAAYDTLNKAEYEQTQVKARRIEAAKLNVEEWATALAEDPDYLAAGNVDDRKRRATDFVTARLGFPSAGVRDRVLSTLRRRRVTNTMQAELL